MNSILINAQNRYNHKTNSQSFSIKQMTQIKDVQNNQTGLQNYNITKSDVQSTYMTQKMMKEQLKINNANDEFQTYCTQAFQKYEQQDTISGQSISQLIKELESIAEYCFQPFSKFGDKKQNIVLETLVTYYTSKNIQINAFTKNLLKQHMELIFQNYQDDLIDIFETVFGIVKTGFLCFK